MKIAIQGHPTRGKEIIRILKNLGAASYSIYDTCSHPEWYWYINKNREITCDPKRAMWGYKLYTLEEFEKEFPFKIGDIVVLKGVNKPHEIITLELYMNKLCYKLDNGLHFSPNALTTYKEMKEERNITLTLDKAKEWYNKGEELKEIALQAFTERELNPLPRSWKEFCRNNPIRKGESWIGTQDMIYSATGTQDRNYKNWTPSQKSAEAHLAMIQLEQLRNCYNNSSNDTNRIAIINNNGNIELYVNPPFNCFLTFKNYLLAREFFSNFKEIIEIAKELI